MKIDNYHKDIVEKRGYEYIGTYEINEIMIDSNKERKRDVYIRVKCFYCKSEYDVSLSGFKRGSNCTKCCNRYEKSFAYHIEVELGLNINDVWDFELNKVNPYHITKHSTLKVWFKCVDKSYHKYEMTCHNFVNKQRCPYCNSFASHKVHYFDSLGFLYHDIAKMIVEDKRNNITYENTYEISPNSHSKYYFKCLECGFENTKKKYLYSIYNQVNLCERCSDNISFPEKFMCNILSQLNINFITQYKPNWSDNKKYDFYIPNLNMIIEVHGLQHYEKSQFNKRNLHEEQENDEYKKELALINDIEKYIVIDCRYSTLKWLKENIEKELTNIFNLNNIDYENLWRKSLKSIVVTSWELYNKGMSIEEISNELRKSQYTIREYLKIGRKLGKCNY